MDRKYYNFETSFKSLKDELSIFLKKSGIYYELSGGAGFWHFEILCNRDEKEDIEEAVNIWFDNNTITEQ